MQAVELDVRKLLGFKLVETAGSVAIGAKVGVKPPAPAVR